LNIGETDKKVKVTWNIKEALLIILLTGMPLEIFWHWGLPLPWWIPIILALCFGILQYFILIIDRLFYKRRIGFALLFFLTIIVGVVTGGLFQSLILRIPNGQWYEVLAPNEQGTDITFATSDFYCVQTASTTKYCCGYFNQTDGEKCASDTYTNDDKRRLKSHYYGLIENRNHLLITPGKPVKDYIDIYYVYSGFFEGTVQNIYLLTSNGQVWNYLQYFNGMEMFLVIFTSIVGGIMGLLHSFIHLIISKKRKLPIKEDKSS
jgi:hypothetical protein